VACQQSFTKSNGGYVSEMVLVNVNGKYLVDHVMALLRAR